jgi:hypothetical protein
MAAKDIKKHQFKKGQTGNPKGRPPIVSDIKTYIREKLAESPTKDADHTKLDAITAKLLNMAFSGNLKAMEICMSYGYGKPSQQIDLNADVNGDINIKIIRD